MYISEFEISDLRSFRGTHRISLERADGTYAGWTVFAGRNGTGKSTLLHALALSVVGPRQALSLVGVFKDWVRHGAKHGSVATLLQLGPSRDPFRAAMLWHPQPNGEDSLDLFTELPGLPTNEVGPWAITPAGYFIAGYGPYRRLGPTTTEITRLSASPTLARLVNLFNEAATLSEAIEWLKHVHTRALENRTGASQLRAAVLEFLGDGLLPDGGKVEKVDSEGLWIQREGVTLPLEHVSDGYRTVAALVVDLLRRLFEMFGDLALEYSDGSPICALPGVVLIDEIDAHMHVEWQQRIGFWLTTHFPNIQFLVTTHSPFICQAASPRGIIRLPAPGEDNLIEHIDGRLFNAIVNGSADDAVMSELFGLEHAHSDKAEDLRREVAKLEVRVLRGQASPEEIERYKELEAQLPDDIGELADRSWRALKGSP